MGRCEGWSGLSRAAASDEGGQAGSGLIAHSCITCWLWRPDVSLLAIVLIGRAMRPFFPVGPHTRLMVVVEVALMPRRAIVLLAFALGSGGHDRLRLSLKGLRVRVHHGLRLVLGLMHRLRVALEGRGETIRNATVIVIIHVVRVSAFALRAVEASLLLLRLLGCCNQPEIMFGVLQIAFGHDGIAG